LNFTSFITGNGVHPMPLFAFTLRTAAQRLGCGMPYHHHHHHHVTQSSHSINAIGPAI
jgi:hypothetical protein